MKNIVFMIINMNVGGTEKALLTMLNELPKDKYHVTVLMLEKSGEFLKYIPNWVNVRVLEEYKELKPYIQEPPKHLAKKLFKEKKYIKGIKLLISYGISKIKKDNSYYYKHILKDIKPIDHLYDVAVAYAGPMEFITYFIANKINAKKKLQWIHFDVTKIGFNKNFAKNIYTKFHKIFVVSKEAKKSLINEIPELEGKTEEFFNIVSSDLVKKMANEGESFNDGFEGMRILTVGRLAKQKGQDLTIPVLARLKADGYKVRWYCIGEGSARTEYEEIIEDLGVKEDYVLMGAHANPYPYVRDCDMYVQSSRHEGYCITVAEARCFDNPIISSKFTGAAEQIEHEKNGLLVNLNSEEMYEAIKRLIHCEDLKNTIKSNLNHNIDTTKEIEKLNKVAELA
ncbi:glycosyltransferase [Clostridium tarantellae]|uniref:Glycosyltransferase n=1 Tax=Clostridium tarantellae TaxID=39493 RepID=A0A6I1MGH2_9CLOT|nr:glycosyltransferase [Clostridium tarantellae]MPQ42280.1 glycosyltransferase [Clostridium tarantellae]